MVSNFIITFIGTAAAVIALTYFVTLGENIDWVAVRLIIAFLGTVLGGITVAVLEDVSLWDLITKRKK